MRLFYFPDDSHICPPGERFEKKCNTCQCAEDGQTMDCTLINCDYQTDNKRLWYYYYFNNNVNKGYVIEKGNWFEDFILEKKWHFNSSTAEILSTKSQL